MPGDIEGFLSAAPVKKKPINVALSKAPPMLDQLENLLDDSVGGGVKLAGGIRHAVGALETLARAGFTFDTLVILVHAKAEPPARGGHPPSKEIVAAVLRAFFRLEEHLR